MEQSNPSKNNSLELPALGLGTYHLQGTSLTTIVQRAYQLGYRHFDTGSYYQNERELGQVLLSYPRKEFQVTSKVWHDNMGYHPVLNSFERSQNKLQVDYIDLFLIHWPHPHEFIMESLEALAFLKKQGKINHYGVSNFTIHHLEEALDAGFEIAANQVEYHPYLNQQDLLNFCNRYHIKIIAYCPLARGKVLEDVVIQKIATHYKKQASQVTLRWLIQKGIHPIPKTQNAKRLADNFNIFDFELTSQEMKQMDLLNQNKRMINHAWSHFDY